MANTPLFIFGETYGTKYALSLADYILMKGDQNIKLKGIALGDSFFSPNLIISQIGVSAFNLGKKNKTKRETALQLKKTSGLQSTLQPAAWEVYPFLHIQPPLINFFFSLSLSPDACAFSYSELFGKILHCNSTEQGSWTCRKEACLRSTSCRLNGTLGSRTGTRPTKTTSKFTATSSRCPACPVS